MFARLLIIGFLLCLPIAIALLSQQMTRTVEPPKIPSSVLQVTITPRQHIRADRLPEQEMPAFHTPRSVKHIHPVDEGEYNPNPPSNNQK